MNSAIASAEILWGLVPPLEVTSWIVLTTLMVSMLLAFLRLMKGPTMPDRVVALDLIALVAVGFMAMYSVATNEPVLLDVAIVLGLIAFLSTVAFARYLETGSNK